MGSAAYREDIRGIMLAREERRGPLVIHVFDGAWTDEQFAGYLRLLDDNLKQEQKYLVICDATTSGALDAKQAKMMARWVKANHQQLQRFCMGSVFVLPSAFMRGVLRALLAFQDLPYPYVVRHSLDEAIEWSRAKVAPLRIP